MNSCLRELWVYLAMRVNGREVQRALLRPLQSNATEFEIVIQDSLVGSFALHEEFILEVSAGDAKAWRGVSLKELKEVLLRAYGRARGTILEEVRIERSDNSPGNSPVRDSDHLPRIPVEGDSSHLLRAGEALSRGNIHYRIVGGIGSRGQVWGHATFLVPSFLAARMLLLGAGFLESSGSQYVVVDAVNGWKIRLLEGQPKVEG